MAAPPKDTIFAYWQGTLLVTKGHTVKILNLWRIGTLSAPKYAEKAQKRCCVLCVWLYLLPSSFKQWPKGHYFIGLRCWLPHNVQKSPLFQTNIKSGLRMQHYPTCTHTHTHALHAQRKLCVLCACVARVLDGRRGEPWAPLPCQRLWQADTESAVSTFHVQNHYARRERALWIQSSVSLSTGSHTAPSHVECVSQASMSWWGGWQRHESDSISAYVLVCVCLLYACSRRTHMLTCVCLHGRSHVRACGSVFVHTVHACQFYGDHFLLMQRHKLVCVCVCVELQLSNTFKSLISPGKWQRSSHRRGMKTTFASDWSRPRH